MIQIVHGCALVLHKGARHKGFGRGFDRLARAGQVQVRDSLSDYFIIWWNSLSRKGYLRSGVKKGVGYDPDMCRRRVGRDSNIRDRAWQSWEDTRERRSDYLVIRWTRFLRGWW